MKASLSPLWEKRNEYWRAKEKADRLRAELRAMEQERARKGLVRLSPHQRLVLSALVDDNVDDNFGDNECCRYRRSIERATGLSRAQSGRALAALQRLGFVAFHRGLFNEDGEVAGSGYATTRAGHDWWWDKESPRQRELTGAIHGAEIGASDRA